MSEQLPAESNEQRFVRLSMEHADEHYVPVSDAAARLMAGQLHGGQTSALYSLASCGAIDLEHLTSEIDFDLYFDQNTPDENKPWLRSLRYYVTEHGDRPRIFYWHELTRDEAIQEALDRFDER